jgi:hypothetical protein
VNACFCRVSAKKNQGRPTCQVYIETKGSRITFLKFGRYEKALDQTGGETGMEAERAPKPLGAAQPSQPIRLRLTDRPSTTFEDE